MPTSVADIKLWGGRGRGLQGRASPLGPNFLNLMQFKENNGQWGLRLHLWSWHPGKSWILHYTLQLSHLKFYLFGKMQKV